MKTTILRSALAALFAALSALPQQAVAQPLEAYVVLSANGQSLTFYYDTRIATRVAEGTVWNISRTKEEDGTDYPVWAGTPNAPNTTLRKVAFDPSFKAYRPTSTRFWFFQCQTLDGVDVTNLNTSAVTDMSHMFHVCRALASLDVSGFNTANATNLSGMFAGCESLTALDVSAFNTASVTDMNSMFAGCQTLVTLFCNDDWFRAGTDSQNMFADCPNLKGAMPYNPALTDAVMANPATGYFCPKAPTAIAAPEAHAAVREIYAPDGRRRAALQPGLNLLRPSGGTARKVLRR